MLHVKGLKCLGAAAVQDEPTSGLDARAAAIVMRTVRNTVNTGRTVVCTIHQPSIDISEVWFISTTENRRQLCLNRSPTQQCMCLQLADNLADL